MTELKEKIEYQVVIDFGLPTQHIVWTADNKYMADNVFEKQISLKKCNVVMLQRQCYEIIGDWKEATQ